MKKFAILIAVGLLLNCQKLPSSRKNPVIAKYETLLVEQEKEARQSSIPAIAEANPLAAFREPTTTWKAEQAMFRDNPFISKYIAKPTQKKQPAKSVRKKAVVRKKPVSPFELNGIIQFGSTRKALINGKLYEARDTIDGYHVTAIQQKTVTLYNGKRTITLQLKEK